jgi:transcriptional regulator with XRE-family HTH domain
MTQLQRKTGVTRKPAATKRTQFRTFLLMTQLEGRAIGARIAQARRESGMTQEQVAEVATFSKRSLQDYEAGITIPYRHMQEIAALLKKPVAWFLHGEPEERDLDRLREELAETRGEVSGLREDLARIRDELLQRAQQPPNGEHRQAQ